MLTQSEIDALLTGEIEPEPKGEATRPGGEAGGGAALRLSKTKNIRPYNFWSPERFSKDQMRAVELVHEDLAERLTTSLPAFLRTVFRPRLIHIEQGRFDDLAQGTPPNTLYNILAFEPLPGRAVLIFSPEVAWVMLEKLLGGSGLSPAPSQQPLTDIGQALVRGAVEFMLDDIKAAWNKVTQLEPRLEDATVNNLWVSMLMRNARVVLVTFELTLQGVTGTMNLYIPFSMLKPVSSALTPTAWMAAMEAAHPSDEVIHDLTQTLSEAALPLSVELGRTELTMGQLSNLTVGDTLRLNTSANQELHLWVGQRVRFRVIPGTLGGRLAVRILGR